MDSGLLWLGLTLALLALAAALWSSYLADRSGLPGGKIIYDDTGAWIPHHEPLYARSLQLVGRPDYLIKSNGGLIIPVELKSAAAPAEPFPGHVLQLAAYCLLVEENFAVRPSHGVIQYRDKAFAVEYSDQLENDLLDLLAEMQQDRLQSDVDRDHNDWKRCASCGLRGNCDQRLA